MRQGNHRYERDLPEELGKLRRRRLFVWIAAGALLVVALGAVTVALLRTPEEQPPPVAINLGVAAAKQYLTEYHADREKLADPAAVALGERLMKEPFEIEADITLSSDDLPAELGLPLTRLLLGIYIKYDMRDLGAKLRVLGMEWLSAYLIDDEVIVRVPSGAYSMPMDVPESAQLSRNMGLGERAMSFAPFLTGDKDFYERIADMAAQAVPAEATVVEEVSGTQPGGEKVIRTALDEAAMQFALANMGELLKEDEALRARAEEIFARTAAYYDLDAKTLEEWLGSVADGSALADDFELRWQVYERQGRYVGLDVEITHAGQVTEWRMRTELSGSESRETFLLSVNGKLVQSAEYTVTYRSGGVAVDGKCMLDTARAIDIKVDIDLEPDGDEYRLFGTVEIEGPLLSDKAVKLNADIDAKIRAGEGLMALKEDSGWNDVYGEQWEPLEGPLKDLILPQM